MASIGHVAVGMAAARFRTADRRWPALVSMLLWSGLSMLPDADVIGFALGVRYGAPWGHRGATHSFVFAIALGVLVGALVTIARKRALPPSGLLASVGAHRARVLVRARPRRRCGGAHDFCSAVCLRALAAKGAALDRVSSGGLRRPGSILGELGVDSRGFRHFSRVAHREPEHQTEPGAPEQQSQELARAAHHEQGREPTAPGKGRSREPSQHPIGRHPATSIPLLRANATRGKLEPADRQRAPVADEERHPREGSGEGQYLAAFVCGTAVGIRPARPSRQVHLALAHARLEQRSDQDVVPKHVFILDVPGARVAGKIIEQRSHHGRAAFVRRAHRFAHVGAQALAQLQIADEDLVHLGPERPHLVGGAGAELLMPSRHSGLAFSMGSL